MDCMYICIYVCLMSCISIACSLVITSRCQCSAYRLVQQADAILRGGHVPTIVAGQLTPTQYAYRTVHSEKHTVCQFSY